MTHLCCSAACIVLEEKEGENHAKVANNYCVNRGHNPAGNCCRRSYWSCCRCTYWRRADRGSRELVITPLPDEVLLKTSGSLLPWVVTIWIIGDADALYVFGAADSSWVKNALADPLVELRIHDRTYALKATPLNPPDPAIYQKYIDRYAPDYPDIVAGMPKADEVEGVGTVFRLSPRV